MTQLMSVTITTGEGESKFVATGITPRDFDRLFSTWVEGLPRNTRLTVSASTETMSQETSDGPPLKFRLRTSGNQEAPEEEIDQ